ncbi:MAG: glycosyltransferase family 2 protein [Candidatus Omnitrophota bacterium]
MKISVITPSYNQARFLETTILSVLNQNYAELEYIIIDGGSDDRSIEIIKKYEKHLSYWVSEKDNGQSEAINKGFKRATGDIVGWINSDDFYAPGCFEKVVAAFEKDDTIGIIYGDNNVIDENGNFIRRYAVSNISLDRLLHGNPNVVQPGSFYKKSFLERTGLLDESLRYVMDYELWLRLLEMSQACHIPENLASFRWHRGSKTINHRVNFCYETLSVRKKYGIRKLCWQNRIVLYRLVRDKLALFGKCDLNNYFYLIKKLFR